MIEYNEGIWTSKVNLWIKRVEKAIEPIVTGFWQVGKCIAQRSTVNQVEGVYA